MGQNEWKHFVYGGTAACIAELGTFPVDTTKTRLQIQGQNVLGYSHVKYKGMLHAISVISKEEGFSALYNGISPAVLRQATYGTIKFGIYYSLKDIFITPERETLVNNVACAVTAGVISSIIANPTDVLKVRLQARSKSLENKNILQAFLHIYQNEGVRGLWRGVVPTAQRAAVIVGVELPTYDTAKRVLKRREIFSEGVALHFVCSFMASFASAIAATPVDVIRTRLMHQRKSQKTEKGSRLYESSMDCLLRTVRYEGFSALYKGFIPTWMRLGPWNIIFFLTLEQLKRL